MRVLLTAINAKYIHSNLAVYSLRAYAAPYRDRIETAEFTINQQQDYILQRIYEKKPDILAFSCYIWNVETVLSLVRDIALVLPETKIWLGGPEVSYNGEELLKTYPEITGIMRGEGEQSFLSLLEYYLENKGEPEEIGGILFRRKDGSIGQGRPEWPALLPLDVIPFPYQDTEDFAHRIIYYESSRGCPFACSYCLSSLDRSVRLRSIPLVLKELQFFLDHKVPQVKFVDRTFNCSHSHAMAIWKFIREQDNGVTNFHFEIEGDLLREDELELLGQMRPGLVQLEIGVQSVNPRTLAAVNRKADFEKIARACRKLKAAGRQHLHLDLIAGLPWEDFDSFRESFRQVYALGAHELQLGFLKVLKGSGIEREADSLEMVRRHRPPYEVLYTGWMSFADLLRLKGVEEMLEVYYNSGQFSVTVAALEKQFANPFDLYDGLAEACREKGAFDVSLSRMQRLNMLRDFIRKEEKLPAAVGDQLLLQDWYLRENAKTRPEWAPDLTAWKSVIAGFYRSQDRRNRYLPDYGQYDWKQVMHMTHLEPFLDGDGAPQAWFLFDYRHRDPITGNARMSRIEENPA